MDEDDSEEDHPTWMEVLSKELPDEGSEVDPDYEVCTTVFLCGHILNDCAPLLISFWSSCKESNPNVKGVIFLINVGKKQTLRHNFLLKS